MGELLASRWRNVDFAAYGLLFCRAVGGYRDGSELRRRYRRAVRAARLRPLRFRDVRATRSAAS